MGGSLRYVTRKDGVVKGWDGYTNAIQEVERPAFLMGQAHANGFADKFSDDPALNGVYPDGYGLVVVDFDHQWIGHHQSYSDLGALHVGMLSLDYTFDLEANTWQLRQRGGHASQLFSECMNAGFFTHTRWSVDTENGHEHVLRPIPEEIQGNETAFLDYLLNEAAIERRWMFGNDGEPAPPESLDSVPLSPPGWTFAGFEGTENGWHQFALTLLEHGFDLSAHAAVWDMFADEATEEQDEDVKVLPPVSVLIVEHLRQTLGDQLPDGGFPRPRKSL